MQNYTSCDMSHDIMWHDVAWHHVTLCDMISNDVTLHNMIPHDIMQDCLNTIFSHNPHFHFWSFHIPSKILWIVLENCPSRHVFPPHFMSGCRSRSGNKHTMTKHKHNWWAVWKVDPPSPQMWRLARWTRLEGFEVVLALNKGYCYSSSY